MQKGLQKTSTAPSVVKRLLGGLKGPTPNLLFHCELLRYPSDSVFSKKFSIGTHVYLATSPQDFVK